MSNPKFPYDCTIQKVLYLIQDRMSHLLPRILGETLTQRNIKYEERIICPIKRKWHQSPVIYIFIQSNF